MIAINKRESIKSRANISLKGMQKIKSSIPIKIPLIKSLVSLNKFSEDERTKQDLKNITYSLKIKFVTNNIFCILQDRKRNQTLFFYSGGLMQLNLTQKNLKFFTYKFINKAINAMLSELRKNAFILHLSGSRVQTKNVASQILKIVGGKKPRKKKGKKEYKKSKPSSRRHIIIVNIEPKKVFNGCNAKKKRRMKARRNRVFSS